MKLSGAITALTTPFKKGTVDLAALRRLIRYNLKSGVSGLVPCGSTGEAATLNTEEYRSVVSTTVDEVDGRVPVIAGCTHSATWRTEELAKEMTGLGADALLVAPPPYNKPQPSGVLAHYRRIAKASPLPIVAYNIPGRTVCNLTPETVSKILDECPSVIAIKEASGSLDQIMDLRARTEGRLTLLSGDDPLTLPMMALGATGVVSVASNVAPRTVSSLCRHALKGNYAAARKTHFKLLPLLRTLFMEGNPAGIKAALAARRIIGEELRLPLTPVSAKTRNAIRKTLAGLK